MDKSITLRGWADWSKPITEIRKRKLIFHLFENYRIQKKKKDIKHRKAQLSTSDHPEETKLTNNLMYLFKLYFLKTGALSRFVKGTIEILPPATREGFAGFALRPGFKES